MFPLFARKMYICKGETRGLREKKPHKLLREGSDFTHNVFWAPKYHPKLPKKKELGEALYFLNIMSHKN